MVAQTRNCSGCLLLLLEPGTSAILGAIFHIWCYANNFEKQHISSRKKRYALVKVRIKVLKDKKGNGNKCESSCRFSVFLDEGTGPISPQSKRFYLEMDNCTKP